MSNSMKPRHVLYQAKTELSSRSSDLVGHTGEKINYSTKETIANYLKKGYELLENGFDADGQPNFDRDANNTNDDGVQEFIVAWHQKLWNFLQHSPYKPVKLFQEIAKGRVYPTPLAPAWSNNG